MKRTMNQLQHVHKIRLVTSCISGEIASLLRVYHDDDDDDDDYDGDDSDEIFVVVN